MLRAITFRNEGYSRGFSAGGSVPWDDLEQSLALMKSQVPFRCLALMEQMFALNWLEF